MCCWCEHLPTFFLVGRWYTFSRVILQFKSSFSAAVFILKSLQFPHPGTARRWRALLQQEVISTCWQRAPVKEKGLFWYRGFDCQAFINDVLPRSSNDRHVNSWREQNREQRPRRRAESDQKEDISVYVSVIGLFNQLESCLLHVQILASCRV